MVITLATFDTRFFGVKKKNHKKNDEQFQGLVASVVSFRRLSYLHRQSASCLIVHGNFHMALNMFMRLDI